MADLGIASVAAITAICYVIGMALKAWGKVDKFIPCIMGILGMVLGVASLYLMPDFPASDIINALAIGAVSGWAATGINQIFKQLAGEDKGE